MNQFIPSIPIKRYPKDVHPNQGMIPMVVPMIAFKDNKIVEGDSIPNIVYYQKYQTQIQYYIDKEKYND